MLSPGTRIKHYDIVGTIGAGGMGEVYRARDTRLGREVAIKVLPDAAANEPDRVARFEREARALAALNHPHIASLYGFEESPSGLVLIMELIEGETLADRLTRGPLPIADALALSRQIADALEAAHERDIVHRDLKPANIKVTPDGVVKVLDFGLAKAMERGAGAGGADLSLSPTLSLRGTQAGVILGTAAYMSPEQAKGMLADHRSDVFSFGCVLYELITGRQAFPGDSVTDILASVLAREPEWTHLPAGLDPRLVRLLQRCLAKSRRQRWQAIGDVRAEIEFILAEPPPTAAIPSAAAAARKPFARAWRMAAVAALAAALAAASTWALRPAAPAPPLVRFAIPISTESALFTNFNRSVLAVSPDGGRIIYTAERLYLRSLSDAVAQPVPGTEGMTSTTHAAFSPDGQSVVFWAASDRTLKRLTLGSSNIVTLCPLPEGGYGLHWVGNDIYFADAGTGIRRVSANGGRVEPIVPLKEREEIYGPQLLPDGDSLLFTLGSRGMPSWDAAQVVLQSMRTGQRTTLVEGATGARYVSSGHLLFGRGGVLFAVPLDLRRKAIVGEPVAMIEGVRRSAPGTTGAVHFVVSDAGTLVYLSGPVSATGASLQLALFDRSGGAEPLNVPLGPYYTPRVSPDGSRVALASADGTSSAIWIHGLSRSSAARRLTFGERDASPAWSPDSQRVAYSSKRDGDTAIWWQRADGSDTPVRLTRAADAVHVPQAFSADGRHLLFDEIRGSRVAIMDLSVANGTVTTFSTIDSDVPSDATFSPDGRWVAYTVRPPTGATQSVIYVEPYPRSGARYQISKAEDDGHHAAWSPDGRELFYTPGPGNRFLAVPITTVPSFAFGDAALIPRPFLNTPPTTARPYDVARDGKRFIGLRTDVGANGAPVAPQIHVVLNWFNELKARVPIE